MRKRVNDMHFCKPGPEKRKLWQEECSPIEAPAPKNIHAINPKRPKGVFRDRAVAVNRMVVKLLETAWQAVFLELMKNQRHKLCC